MSKDPEQDASDTALVFHPGWGARLRALRLGLGYTQQKDLGKAVGIAAMTVSRHETEAAVPEISTLAAYCRVLRTNAQYLQFGTNGPNPHAALIEAYFASPYGMGVSEKRPDIAARMRAFHFPSVGLEIPTLDNVHALRLFLETQLPRL